MALLPSATTLRFLVLITATVGVTIPLVDPLVFALRAVGVLPEHGREACVTHARDAAPEVTGEWLVESYVACVRAAAQAAEALVVVGMFTPLLLGVVIYSVFPLVVRRRLAPLPRQSHASLYERADAELDRALGPARRRTRLLVTPGTAGGARAFGAWGRYWVAVDRSTLASGDPPGGEAPRVAAVIHHEAAHVRNRDIDITYLTISVWWGFFLVAVATLPFVLVPPVLPQVALPLLASLVLLSYARSRVLRVRECYADVRAGQRPEVRAELSRLLSTVDRDRSDSANRWWSALHRRHPPAHERIAVLRDPARLLRGGLIDVAYAGCAAGMAFPGLSRVISQLVDDSWSGGLVALLIGLPLAVILTVIVWRSVLRAVLGGGAAPRPWPIALSLTGGLLVGQLMLPALPPTTWGRSLVEAPVPSIVLAGFLFGGCYLVTQWMSRDAVLWLSVTRAQWPMWAAAVVGISMVGFVLMTWFAAVQTLSLTTHHWSGMVTWAITVMFTDGHVWLTAAVGLGASLPMAAYLAWARRRGVGSPSFQLAHRVCPPWLPVGAAALTTLGTAVAVALITPLLRSAAPEVGDDFSPTASATALLPTFILVGVVALAGAAILGWTLGGAGSSGRVLNAVAASVFLQAFFVVPATRVGGVTGNCARIPNPTLDCWSDRLFSDLAASSGVTLGTYAFVVLLLPAWGAALTASAARALLLGAPREFHPPRRHLPSVLATAALLLVTVIAVVDLGARLAPGEGVGGGPLTESVTQAAREPVQRESREGRETCEAVDQTFQEVSGTILPTENVTLSQVRATRAMSESTDPTLVAFSEPALDALRDGHRPTSWDHLMAAKFYCGVVHPGTGILI